MMHDQTSCFTAFEGQRRIASGPLTDVALAVKHAGTRTTAPIAIYSDETGRPIDLDLRGSDDEIAARLRQTLPVETTEASGGPQTGRTARPRPAETRRGRARGDAAAAALGVAERATRRGVGRLAQAARRGAPSK